MRTDTRFVKSFTTKESKDKTGRRCTTVYKELHQTVGTKKLGESQKAKALWSMKAAEDRDEQFCDPTHQKDMQGRPQTRLVLWEEHLKSPVAALAKALECFEAT